MNDPHYFEYDSDYSPQKLKGKAILLGESGVGKTSIITRLKDNSFTTITATTLGSSSTEKKYTFNNIELKLDIWDTAGQEIYRSLNRIFYRDANIIVLVYDITKRKSFEEMKSYWYRQIEVFGVAANKCDLYNQAEVNENEGKEFAEQINGVFQETSASTDCGISDFFGLLAKKYIIALLKGGNDKKEDANVKKIGESYHERKFNNQQSCCG